jgi:ketosteroid isomerase-like protein
MDINRPEVVDQLAEVFAAYEKALAANDAEEIMSFFATAPDPVRFGIADQQDDWPAQLAWRRAEPPLPPGRALHDTRISAFGADLGVVTTLFSYPGSAVTGRQSQTWVRLPAGWRIVSAHVSHPAA